MNSPTSHEEATDGGCEAGTQRWVLGHTGQLHRPGTQVWVLGTHRVALVTRHPQVGVRDTQGSRDHSRYNASETHSAAGTHHHRSLGIQSWLHTETLSQPLTVGPHRSVSAMGGLTGTATPTERPVLVCTSHSSEHRAVNTVQPTSSATSPKC